MRRNLHIPKVLPYIRKSFLASTWLILFTLLSPPSFSQSPVQVIEMADNLFNKKDFYGAGIWYKKALKEDPGVLSLVFKYAETLRHQNNYEAAASQYFYVSKKDRGKNFPLANFWYPMMLKQSGEYAEAKKFFKRAKPFFSNKREGYFYQKILQEIRSCEFAISSKLSPLSVTIDNIGASINTEDSELAAFFLNDSNIIYSSLKDQSKSSTNIVTDTLNYLVRLFLSQKKKDTWNQGILWEKEINASNFHVANGSFSEDGKTFYFSKCRPNGYCRIYASEYNNSKWEPAYEIYALNQENSTSTQPWCTRIHGQEVIFFSSNRKGGFGGMDIWYSIRNSNNNFIPPVNLGKTINSMEDEITPFYNQKDSSLYFSSNWYKGLGGFDIFKSKTNLLSYSPIENLGYPINSGANDFYYNSKNNVALFTSNRAGSVSDTKETCCNDIYTYEIPDTLQRIYTSLEELARYLPVKLYFHNDCPNPRTLDTTTQENYIKTYQEYIQLYNTYQKEYTKGLRGSRKTDASIEMQDLFEDYIKKGASDLAQFTPLLVKELEKGKKITLTIKGYASPLSKSDYNVNLTLRRIASLINYLKEYESGRILPFIDGTAKNGGKLNFIKVPFGEYQAINSVSDNVKDKRNSVYSNKAALERKIEIIAITEDSNSVTLDGNSPEKLPLLTFRDSIFVFPKGTIEKKFNLINNGETDLKIFSVKANHPGINSTFPNENIPTYTPSHITIRYDSTMVDPGNYSVTFLTNTIPNQIKKEIVLK